MSCCHHFHFVFTCLINSIIKSTHDRFSVNLFRPMEFFIKFDTVQSEWSIVYIVRSLIIISKNYCTFFSEDWFCLSKQGRPWWNAASCIISSGSSLFAKVNMFHAWIHDFLPAGVQVRLLENSSDNLFFKSSTDFTVWQWFIDGLFKRKQ